VNLRGALLGLALFTLSSVFILSGFIVKSLRDRMNRGRGWPGEGGGGWTKAGVPARHKGLPLH
jgi:hypothetical protein